MREIKFRAWDKDEKVMREGVSVSYTGEPMVVVEVKKPIGYEDRKEKYAVQEDLIVMQYTGLKDKNGKEIYEGDIVAIYNWNGNKTAYHRYSREIKWREDYITGFNIGHGGKNYEVIGNIYENKDLLV